MNKLEREVIKNKLLNMLSELEDVASISKSSTATVVLDQASVGRLSRMDALQGQQMAMETERRRQQELIQVKAALARIDSNDFGYCVSCEEEISAGRLGVNPTAIRCVKCSE